MKKSICLLLLFSCCFFSWASLFAFGTSVSRPGLTGFLDSKCVSPNIKLSTGACVVPLDCKNGKLDKSTNTCSCSKGLTLNPTNNCVCASPNFITSSGACIAPGTCTGGQVLNKSDNTCGCPSPKIYVAGNCVTPATCSGGQVLNTTNNTCSCVSPNIFVTGTCQSPKSCTGTQVLNKNTNTCEAPVVTCQSGQVLKKSTNKCIPTPKKTDTCQAGGQPESCDYYYSTLAECQKHLKNCVYSSTDKVVLWTTVPWTTCTCAGYTQISR